MGGPFSYEAAVIALLIVELFIEAAAKYLCRTGSILQDRNCLNISTSQNSVQNRVSSLVA